MSKPLDVQDKLPLAYRDTNDARGRESPHPTRGRTGARLWGRSVLLLATMIGIAAALATWKSASVREANAAAANQPEPIESVTVATAREREHRETTTAIGTVLALRSVTLRNEVAGTVRRVALTPGDIVEAGTLLVALDVSVEEAELKAQQAEAALAETRLARMERLLQDRVVAQGEFDPVLAERDVARARIARMRATIEKKTLRAPFRARVGIADVHPGQYLPEGTLLTTLQGVDPAAHVDFAVAQRVAAALREGQRVEVFASSDAPPISAEIIAIDARVDPATRNATVRARAAGSGNALAPGASVRVLVPVGPPRPVVTLPASALRKGPGGDHVFVIEAGQNAQGRARLRSVQSGPLLGDEVVIFGGVAAGEQVAASGSFKLREGVLVGVAGAQKAAVNGGRS
jgi:membrane fusion protein (multidrug efflux system)